MEYSMREIPGHPGYFLTPDARIFCNRTWRKLSVGRDDMREISGWVAANGYKMLTIREGGGAKKYYLHALMLHTFIGPPAKGQVCRHGPNGKTDNSIQNLEWGSQKENIHDMQRDGVFCYGERAGLAKMSRIQARVAYRLHSTRSEHGLTNRQIAQVFNVTPESISKIGVRSSWARDTQDIAGGANGL